MLKKMFFYIKLFILLVLTKLQTFPCLTFFPFLDFLDLDLATEDCLDAADKADPGPDMFEDSQDTYS